MFVFDPQQNEIDNDVQRTLRGWNTLSTELTKIKSIPKCIYLLKYELTYKQRPIILQRLEARIVSLASKAIRKELEVLKEKYL